MSFKYDPSDRQRVGFHVVIRLLQPLSHISEAVGNQTNLRTTKLLDLEGEQTEVFALSGNSLRNRILRRCGLDDFLEQVGVQVSPILHHTLFCGGAIDGGTGSDLELDRRIRQLLPGLSLLGTAKPKGVFASNNAQMVPGRICVGDAVLVCAESAEYVYRQFPPVLPDKAIAPLSRLVQAREHAYRQRANQWLGLDSAPINTELQDDDLRVLEEVLPRATEWLTWQHKIRQDSLKDPNLARHLSDVPLLDGTTDTKAAKSQQMLMGNWFVQAGATLYSYWSADITRVEEGFIAAALAKFSTAPYLGGQIGAGCGLCTMDIWYQSENDRGAFMQISPSAQMFSDRAQESYTKYRDYLQEYRQFLADAKSDIRKMLNG